LGIAVEPIEHVFRSGETVEFGFGNVAEWWVTEIMRECGRFDHIRIDSSGGRDEIVQGGIVGQMFCQTSANLRDFQGMGQTGMKLRLFIRSDNLGNAGEPTQGRRVEDSIAISLTCGPLVWRAIAGMTAIVASDGHD
jgi:hypothetical protein